MEFTEKTQVFLVATWYKELVRAFGERGRRAFVLAVKHYARQRGERMAQRAVGDGQPLDYASYCAYREWAPSEESVREGTANATTVCSTAPDYVYEVRACAWYDAFAALDALEAGQLYCRHLDEAMARAFSPSLEFYTVETRHCADRCVFCIRNAGFDPQQERPRRPEQLRGFDYHCAHTFYAFGEVAAGAFGRAGAALAARVLDSFEQAWGGEARRRLTAFAAENFDRA